MLTNLEIDRRLPVWHAFADLFLDTELQPEDHRRIAATLSASRYPPAELRAILEDEVAPAFLFNLLAGEWAGWSEESVRRIMLDSLRSARRSPLGWLKKRLCKRHVAEQWAKLEPLLEAGQG